jgi:hypothetical protein
VHGNQHDNLELDVESISLCSLSHLALCD